MRIGILTQPLYINYGGILQCYALQKKLQQLGHETVVLQREFYRHYTLIGGIKHYSKQLAKLVLGKQPSWRYYVAQEKRDYISRNTSCFITNNIYQLSKKCYSTQELAAEFDSHNLDAVIVGSDQVWRTDYSPCQPNYFLDFLLSNNNVKKISYAASFGTDHWLFTSDDTKYYADLIRHFDAVSVRESSAIRLCQEHLGVDAVQVLDPTMLLDREDYINLISNNHKRGALFCYMLDKTSVKQNVVDEISRRTGFLSFENMPQLVPSPTNLYADIDKCVAPSVEDWLSAFMEAEMVITDSFHGCVFSIIFNKPFWAIGNKERGMARFESLLQQFNLQDRLITPSEISTLDLLKTINWTEINQKRETLKSYAIDFINKSLRS